MKMNNLVLGIAVMTAGLVSVSSAADKYWVKLKEPNGYRIPKIMGASGDQALMTGYDYFDWYGITQHRTWFKPSYSSLADNSKVLLRR